MIDDKKISVVLSVCRDTRAKTIGDICTAWLAQPIDELILCDCTSGGLPIIKADQDPRFSIVTFEEDPGTRARHAIATLSIGDFVIQPDDDVLPKLGFTKELFDWWTKLRGIVGIIGRRFNGPLYKGQTTFYRAKKINEPVLTDFVGVVYGCGRDCLGMDLRDMGTPYNDLYWCCEAHRDKPKHVVPVRCYEDMPSCNDSECLFHNPQAREIRQTYYAALWESHYKTGVLIK